MNVDTFEFKYVHRYDPKTSTTSLEAILKNLPEGWHSIIRDGFQRMIDAGWLGQVEQCKEKFGSLRLYINSQTVEGMDSSVIDKIVEEIENQTCIICSVCGAPSTKHSTGWIMFYCDEHFPTK